MSYGNDESEHWHQCELIQWARASGIPELDLLYAIPNGARTAIKTAVKLKAEGLKRGIPDLCLPVARGGYHALYVEMKALKGSLSKDQKLVIGGLIEQGNRVVVCKGWEAAKTTILDYLTSS